MRKLLLSLSIILIIGLGACNSGRMSDQEIDSLNKASADSLLQDALEDTMEVDNLRTDSVKPL